MPWIIIGVAVAALVGLGVAWYVVSSRQIRQWEERIERKGELLMCWIASASDSLYEEHDVPGYGTARVVFSTSSSPGLKRQLKEAARRLSKGDGVDPDVDMDKFDAFYDKIKAQVWLHPPMRLPKWLVGDGKFYTATVNVYWRRLPELCLTLPYVYCYVLLGEGGGTVHAEYPDDE